jgi:elongation factor G
VFKTIADPYIGRLNMFRIFTGKLKADNVVYNATKEKDEKITQLLVMTGKEQSSVPEMNAGDIGAVAKLAVTSTSDILSVKANPTVLAPIEFPKPTLSTAIEPKSKVDEDKLSGALQRICEEDPTVEVEKNVETKQTVMRTMGDTHMDIIIDKLSRKFGVEVVTKEMRIPYRETIRGTVEVEGKHKKQSGGHGQYGHVWIKFEPNDEEEFKFEENVFGGSVPRNFFPAVEKGLQEALDEGVLAGYPVTRIKATLYDGSYHSVDSSEMAFKTAAKLAFKKGVEAAKPVLLEPIMNVEIEIPDAYMGDIIGDLNSKRGRVMGMEPAGKKQIVKAQVPLAEMSRYTIDLKSITQGRGKFRMEMDHYEEVPAQDTEKIVAKAKQEREEKEK